MGKPPGNAGQRQATPGNMAFKPGNAGQHDDEIDLLHITLDRVG